MTREQIEAEFYNFSSTLPSGHPWNCIDFALHIAKLEREECAKVSQGFGLSEYETLKQERDKYRQALVEISKIHYIRIGTQKIIDEALK